VRVADGFDWRQVRQCTFCGDVQLGRFGQSVRVSDGLELPAGLAQATISNCVIGNDVLVRDIKLLANYLVADGAVLLDCGTITCDRRTTFGNGATLPIGIESGGREVAIFAEMDCDLAARVARSRGRPEFLQQYAQAVADYTAQVVSDRGVIGQKAVLCSTPKVRNTYVGAHACIDGATLVSDCTMLSSADEPVRIESGACVSSSLLQWGSQVSTLAVVDRSVLTEHSHARNHGKVNESILGPNSGVAGGEVAASLLGPLVSFHHQALLIATLWPEGKGNVAYGANVGSNHTAKAPDQEFWPGEGMFLGLGINIKFPADFRRAPYSIIACGVTTLPQKVLFPFSLINVPSAHPAGISSAFNEIIPAWLLTDNLYTLKRNEGKYRARYQGRRLQIDFRIFRSDIVDYMRDACKRLEAVRPTREAYSEAEIEGLGKNFLLEKHRKPAIEAYRFFIRYYALLLLKEEVEAALRNHLNGETQRILVTPSSDGRWEHARQILCQELGVRQVVAGLRQLPAMFEQIARDVEASKARDDERGPRIIEDYAQVHVPAADDPLVRQTWEDARRMRREVEELVHCLEGHWLWNGNGVPIHEKQLVPTGQGLS
jgi:hypothetical protein